MHMLSRKDLDSAELDTGRVSRNPTTVITTNGEVQTDEEATVVTVQIFEDTPAVPSPGNLSDVPMSGSVVKNHTFIKNGRTSNATLKICAHCCPKTGSSSSSASTSPTSLP